MPLEQNVVPDILNKQKKTFNNLDHQTDMGKQANLIYFKNFSNNCSFWKDDWWVFLNKEWL